MDSRIIYTPRERPRTHRKTKKSFFAFFIILTAVLFLGGIFYALLSSKWRIQEVEISGTETLDAGALKTFVFLQLQGNYLFFIPRNSLFTVQKDSLVSSLKVEFPKIETVTIEKKFPHTLGIILHERKLWGVTCSDSEAEKESKCVYIDVTGFAVEDAPLPSGSLISKIKTNISDLAPGSQLFPPDLMEKISFLEKNLQQTFRMEVVNFEFSSKIPTEIRAKTSDGFTIIFLREDNFENAFKVLKTVLDEEIKEKTSQLDYIDLRFGNKVFYKWQGGIK